MNQIGLNLRERFSWGGRRAGAGRTTKKAGAPRHRARPALSRNYPIHVTLRLARATGNVRRRQAFKLIREAFRAGRECFGFRLIHYSVQRDHIHILTEADNREALSRALKGLQVRIARALSTLIGRSGKVFNDRYHEHILKNPQEVRNALRYVL